MDWLDVLLVITSAGAVALLLLSAVLEARK